MKKIAVCAAVAILVSACGGGGDSEPMVVGGGSGTVVSPPVNTNNPTVVALSAANFDVAGKEVMAGATNAGSLTNSVGFLTGAEVSTSVSFPQFVRMKFPLVVNASNKPAVLSGVSLTETVPCTSGGSVTLSGNVNNENNPTPGDTISMNASNCKEDGSTINGSLTIRISSISGNIDSYPFSVGMEASTSNFQATSGTSTFQSNGSLSIGLSATSASSQDMSVTIPSMTSKVTAGTKSETFQYSNYKMAVSVRGSSSSMTLSGGMSVPSLGSNMLTVQTTQPFVSTTSYPTSGSATATTAVGGKMRITASSGNTALIELDAASDGIYEASKSVPWNEIF